MLFADHCQRNSNARCCGRCHAKYYAPHRHSAVVMLHGSRSFNLVRCSRGSGSSCARFSFGSGAACGLCRRNDGSIRLKGSGRSAYLGFCRRCDRRIRFKGSSRRFAFGLLRRSGGLRRCQRFVLLSCRTRAGSAFGFAGREDIAGGNCACVAENLGGFAVYSAFGGVEDIVAFGDKLDVNLIFMSRFEFAVKLYKTSDRKSVV